MLRPEAGEPEKLVGMKAFVVEKYGNEGLRAADVREPIIGDRELVVRAAAASINPLDKMVRDCEFKKLLKYKPPFTLGHDVAGVVTQVGAEVRNFKVGDEAFARPRDVRVGTFAELIAIDQDDVAPKPTSLTLQEAAAVPLVALARGRSSWSAQMSSPVRRCSSTPAPAAWARPSSSWPSTSAPPWTTTDTATVKLVRSLGADIVPRTGSARRGRPRVGRCPPTRRGR